MLDLAFTMNNFNSIKVQLRQLSHLHLNHLYLNFNSIKVQLRRLLKVSLQVCLSISIP